MATPSSDEEVVMSWLRIDDKFAGHPKVLALTDREFRAHVSALCYCAEYGTDGVVPRAAWRQLGITPKMAARFLELGLWDENDRIHDWPDYNPSDPTNADRQRRHRMKTQSMTAAHTAVHAALKSGELVRQPCEVCGSTYNVVAHHEDYSRPLDVVWLCRPCHADRRAEITEAVTANVTEGVTESNDKSNGSARVGSRARPVPIPLGTVSEINTISETAAEPSAQTLTGEFVDACRGADIEAPRRVIGQIAQQTGNLLREGISGDAIRLGYRRMVSRGLIQPTMLPNFVAEASIPSGLRAVNGRGLTPSEIVARTQEAL